MPRAIVAPSTTLILSDAEAAAQLSVSASAIHSHIEDASRQLADDLGYPVAYGTWEDDLPPTGLQSLVLPTLALVQVVSVTPSGGAALDAAGYRVDLPTSTVARIGSWSSWAEHDMLRVGGNAPSWWTVRYRAGWWLSTMAGERPADVEPLPHTLRRAFVELVGDMYHGAKLPRHIEAAGNEGASVRLRKPGGDDALARYYKLIRPYRLNPC